VLEPETPLVVTLRPDGHATLLCSGLLGAITVTAIGGDVLLGGGEVGSGTGELLESGESTVRALSALSDSLYASGGSVELTWTPRAA
jgi:hypothetical protein